MYDKEYQKRYYQEHREEKLEYARKRNRNPSLKEKKAQYMRQYRKENLEKWDRTPEQQKKINARKRELYARDEWRRIKARAQAREWQKKHPKKRKAQRLKQYKLTLEEFNQILENQQGRCAICGYSDQDKPSFFPLVDHCHKTGKVRGLLCLNCNHGLGQFKDDPHLLRLAANYLETNSQITVSKKDQSLFESAGVEVS